MKMTRLFAFLALILLFSGLQPAPTRAEDTPPPSVKAASLSDREKKDVARIETYLNTLKSVSARFIQVNDRGSMRTGEIALQRPGKMRVTYDDPDKDFIVADGSFVNIWDDEMSQTSTIPLGSGIADFILREKIALSGDVTVTRFAYYPAKIEVSLVSNKEPGEGELTLVFEDKPLRLRQWRVLDAQGHTTGVNLQNAREDVTFPESTFRFMAPNFGKSRNARG